MINQNEIAVNAIPVNVRVCNFNENFVVASVPRNTISMDAVLNEAATLTTGLDKFQISHAAEILKNVFTRFLKTGNSVSVLDLGTLYLVPKGSVDSVNPSTSDIQGFVAKFTTSSNFQKELKKLTAANIQVTDTNPIISSVINTHTKEDDNTLISTFSAKLVGRKLKLGGDGCGIWFASFTVDSDGVEKLSDESEWIKVPDNYITRNTPTEVSFDLPRNLTENEYYKIVFRTGVSSNKPLKNCIQGISKTIKIIPIQ